MPRVLAKLPFADKQGLEDLMWVLAELNLAAHQATIIGAWKAKNVQLSACHLDGWKVDQY